MDGRTDGWMDMGWMDGWMFVCWTGGGMMPTYSLRSNGCVEGQEGAGGVRTYRFAVDGKKVVRTNGMDGSRVDGMG